MEKVKNFTKIKAIGMDLDGTLYHSPPEMSSWIARQLVEIVAGSLGKKFDEIEEEYLRRRDQYRSNTLTLNSFGLDGEQIFQKLFDEIPMEKYIVRDVRLKKLIAELKKRYRLFIISNGEGRQVVKKLKFMGLQPTDFDPLIACYDHEGWMKPLPAPFLAALETLQLKPEETVYVGDRVETDIEGARAVGMKTIYVGGECERADVAILTIYDIEDCL